MIDHIRFAAISKEIRRLSILATSRAKASHVGGALSIADALAYLYEKFDFATRPGQVSTDTFILSKGHCCIALYAVLAIRNNESQALLEGYGIDGSCYMTHCSSKVDGVVLSTGSLGHGLPVAVGISLSRKISGRKGVTVVLLSDGELQEGTTWESLNFARKQNLTNLIVLVDSNGLQGLGPVDEVIDRRRQSQALEAIVGTYREADGHDFRSLDHSIASPTDYGPVLVMLNTVKGKGVDFMEHNNDYHYRSLSEQDCKRALGSLT